MEDGQPTFSGSACVLWVSVFRVFFGGRFSLCLRVLGLDVLTVTCYTQLLCNQNCFPVSSVVGSVSVPVPLSHSVMSIPVHL